MLGAIIGDIAGSRYEGNNIKAKEFPFFSLWDSMTDDSMMTLAVARALLDSGPGYLGLGNQATARMQQLGRQFPDCGFGGHFRQWILSAEPQPYGSWGNGAAMRVSPCGWAGQSLSQVKALADAVTEVSHNHPEGMKGAEAAAEAVYLARTGSSKEEIRKYIEGTYYALDFTLDEIRENYRFDVSCQGSVPPAIEAFLESRDFEDAIRNAISIGGDSDTIAAITGGIAEAFYGIPQPLRKEALTFFESEELLVILQEFERKYPPKIL